MRFKFATFILVCITLISQPVLADFGHWFTPTSWFKPIFTFVSEKHKASYENDAWAYAKFVVNDLFTEKEKAACGFNTKLPKPTTVALDWDNLQERYQEHRPVPRLSVNGFYSVKTGEVFYLKKKYDTLVHEYMHYILWHPVQDGEQTIGLYTHVEGWCLVEAVSRLSAASYVLRGNVKYLQRRVRHLEKVNNIKQ
jgi:hypothetical protein